MASTAFENSAAWRGFLHEKSQLIGIGKDHLHPLIVSPSSQTPLGVAGGTGEKENSTLRI